MLAGISAEFREALPARIAAIDALWDQFTQGDNPRSAMDELIRALHAVAGSAETFGFGAVGQAAARVESRLQACHDAGQALDVASTAEIKSLLMMLRHAAAETAA